MIQKKESPKKPPRRAEGNAISKYKRRPYQKAQFGIQIKEKIERINGTSVRMIEFLPTPTISAAIDRVDRWGSTAEIPQAMLNTKPWSVEYSKPSTAKSGLEKTILKSASIPTTPAVTLGMPNLLIFQAF